MEDTKMYQAIMITSTNIAVLRVSNSKKQLKEFIRDYIHSYVKDLYGWGVVRVINGENCYTILRISNEFIAAFKIRSIACIEASPEELEEEEIENRQE